MHSLTVFRLLWAGAWREDLFSCPSQLHLKEFSHCCLLCKLRSIGVGGQFLSIVTEFLTYRRQRVRLDECSASVDVVLGVPQGSVLEPFLYIM